MISRKFTHKKQAATNTQKGGCESYATRSILWLRPPRHNGINQKGQLVAIDIREQIDPHRVGAWLAACFWRTRLSGVFIAIQLLDIPYSAGDAENVVVGCVMIRMMKLRFRWWWYWYMSSKWLLPKYLTISIWCDKPGNQFITLR